MHKISIFFKWLGWKSKLALVLLINGVIAYYFLNIGFNLSKKHSISEIKLYINKTYPIIVVEDFMLNDWTYVKKIKENKMNETYNEVSIHLDEDKKE